jgi:cell division protein FtsB|tara:strand:+ start:73163 stop:73486 length:324 start_codon:yes stop_codon:yes gene_type:complete
MNVSTRFADAYQSYVRPILAPTICLLTILFFGWHTLAGETGLLALGGYQEQQVQLQKQAKALAERRADLERKRAMLGDRIEPDYGEELVREKLGLVHDDEIIVRLED